MIAAELPVAAGRAAQHCGELLSRAAILADPAEELARLAERFARCAASALAELCDVRDLRVETGAVSLVPCEEVFAKLGIHSVNSFLSLERERVGALVSVATCELIAQFERLLGGDGRVDRTNVRLPQSAMQFASRFEQRILAALRMATDRAEIALAASQGKAREIAPFAAGEDVWAIDFTVTPPAGASWTLSVALCPASLAQLVGTRAASPATGRAIGERGMEQSAIGQVDLPLRAILVDAAVPLSRLAQLQPGLVIAVPVNRSIPLIIENAVIAHANAGEIDDRIALEITHTALSGKPLT